MTKKAMEMLKKKTLPDEEKPDLMKKLKKISDDLPAYDTEGYKINASSQGILTGLEIMKERQASQCAREAQSDNSSQSLSLSLRLTPSQ